MNRHWITSGLTVASATLVMGGIMALLAPNRVGAAIGVGAIGGAGVATATEQRSRKRYQQLEASILLRVRQTVEESLVVLLRGQESITAKLDELQQLPTPVTDFSFTEEGTVTHGRNVDVDHPVVQWLETNGISVESHRQRNPELDEVLDGMAQKLGESSSQIKLLFPHLQQAIRRPDEVEIFSLRDKASAERNLSEAEKTRIRNITFVCSQLRKNELIQYRYRPKSRTVELLAGSNGIINGFLAGKWFERYVSGLLLSWCRTRNLDPVCLINTKIQLSTGNHIELDLLFWIEGEPLLLECKTGNNYDGCLSKYAEYYQLLNMPRSHVLVILLNCSDKKTERLTQQYGVQVANEKNVTDAIENIFFRRKI